ncbi:MAG: NTP transferase domain-containing protein, partial [Pseudomonadota bacterium]
MTTVGILLAAGASARFGPSDKLVEKVNGDALVAYAGRSLACAGCDALLAVTSNKAVDEVLPGFELVRLSDSNPSQSASLKAGVARAQSMGATRVLIMLGDMPFVSIKTA